MLSNVGDQFSDLVEDSQCMGMNMEIITSCFNQVNDNDHCRDIIEQQIIGDRCPDCQQCSRSADNFVDCMTNNIELETSLCDENDTVCDLFIESQWSFV